MCPVQGIQASGQQATVKRRHRKRNATLLLEGAVYRAPVLATGFRVCAFGQRSPLASVMPSVPDQRIGRSRAVQERLRPSEANLWVRQRRRQGPAGGAVQSPSVLVIPRVPNSSAHSHKLSPQPGARIPREWERAGALERVDHSAPTAFAGANFL